MKVIVSCPCCSSPSQVPTSAAGQRVRCPRCSQPFTVSVPDAEVLPAAPPPAVRPVEPPAAAGPKADGPRITLALALVACVLLAGLGAAGVGGVAVWWWLRPTAPAGPEPQANTATSGPAERDVGDKPADKPAEEDLRAARRQSQKNLEQIALAFHNFHDALGKLPPSLLIDQSSQPPPPAPGKPPTPRPLLSWRVLLLPFLDEDRLYREFHLDEPWDSPHNKKLLAKMPKVYAPVGGKTAEPYSTYYQVFTGEATPFPPPLPPQFLLPKGAPPNTTHGGMTLARIADGTQNTFLVVEAGEPVPWTKPTDLEYDAKKPLPRLGGLFSDGFNAAFCDGKVYFVPAGLKEDTLRALVTSFGGEPIDRNEVLKEQLRKGEAPLFRGKEAAAWLEQMASPDAALRAEAVKGLAEMAKKMGKVKEARPQVEAGRQAVLRAVHDPDGSVVSEALRSLGMLDLDADVVVPAFLSALVDVEDVMPAEIFHPLMDMGPRAVPALCKALGDDDDEVRARAAFVLNQLGQQGKVDEKTWRALGARSGRIQDALAAGKGRAASLEDVLALLEALHEKSPGPAGPGSSRVEAGRALGRATAFGRLAVPHLCRGSRQEGNLIRAQLEAGAVEGLSTDRAEQEPVLAAVEALENSGAEGVLLRLAPRLLPELLLHVRNAGDDRVWPSAGTWAVRLLGGFGPAARDAVPLLLRLLRSLPSPAPVPDGFRHDPVVGRFPLDPTLRREVVRALGRIGPAAWEAAEDLERLLKDPEEAMRLQAAEALLQVDPARREKALPVLRELERGRDDFLAIDAALLLARHGAADRATVAALLRSNSDPGHAFQNRVQQVAEQLARLSRQAGRALAEAGRPLLQSKEPRVRQTAARLLAPFDPEACLPVLGEILKEAGGNERAEVSVLLQRLGPKAKALFPIIQARLQEAAKTKREGLATFWLDSRRPELVKALAAVDPDAALPVLVKLWRTPPPKDGQGMELMDHYVPALDAFDALREMGPRLEKILPTLLEDVRADAGADEEHGPPALVYLMTPTAPTKAGMLLARLGPPAVPGLLKVSADSRPAVQARAAAILGELGAGARPAVPRLLEQLQSGDVKVRREVVRSLGRIDPRDRKVIEALIALRDDRDVEIRRRVVRALGAAGPVAAEALTAALADADADVCLGAAAALGRLGKDSVPALRTALRHRSAPVRRLAVLAQGSLGPEAPGTVAGLLEAVRDRDPETRCLALGLLDRPGRQSGEVVAALVRALGDSDRRVRWAAALTLEELGPDAGEAAAALARSLTDSDRHVRRRAVLALRALGPKARPAVVAVQKLLVGPEDSGPRTAEDLSEDAALTLLRVAPNPAALLADTLKAAPPGRREAVTRAMLRLSPPAVPVLLELTRAADADVRVRAIRCLGQSDAPPDTLVPRLIELLGDGNILVRRQAVSTLGELGPRAKAALEPLRTIAADQQDLAHEAAREAVRRIAP